MTLKTLTQFILCNKHVSKLPLALIFSATVLLSACSQTPSHLIVAPQLIAGSNGQFQHKQAKITVTDLRTGNHIVQILRQDEAAQLFSAQAPLKDILASSITTQLSSHGLIINNHAVNTIEVSINKALISVNQQLMQYKSNSEIKITVKVNNSEKTLTNTFRTRGNSHGPLKADIAVLERDFNQQLTGVLNQIADNNDIQQFLR